MKVELDIMEAFCLVRCCHIRRDQIDKEVTALLGQINTNGGTEAEEGRFPEPALVASIIHLDGERFLIDKALVKLWKSIHESES